MNEDGDYGIFKPQDKCICDSIKSGEYRWKPPSANYMASYMKTCCIENIIIYGKYDVNAHDLLGTTFMHQIRSHDQLELAIRYGGNINATDIEGVSVLCDSVRQDEDDQKDIFKEKVLILLGYGADINFVDERGFTVFDYVEDELKIQRKKRKYGCFCFLNRFIGDESTVCGMCGRVEELEMIMGILKNHRKKVKTFFQKMIKKCGLNTKKRRF